MLGKKYNDYEYGDWIRIFIVYILPKLKCIFLAYESLRTKVFGIRGLS